MYSGIPECLLSGRPEPTGTSYLCVGYGEQGGREQTGTALLFVRDSQVTSEKLLPLPGLSCLRGMETRGLEPTTYEIHPSSKTLQPICLLRKHSQGARHRET